MTTLYDQVCQQQTQLLLFLQTEYDKWLKEEDDDEKEFHNRINMGFKKILEENINNISARAHATNTPGVNLYLTCYRNGDEVDIFVDRFEDEIGLGYGYRKIPGLVFNPDDVSILY